MKRFAIIIIMVFIANFITGIQCIAQNQSDKTDLEKVRDINERITPEYLKKFTEDMKLHIDQLKPEEDIIKKLSKKSYYDFNFSEQQKIGTALVNEFLTSHKLYTSDPLIVKYVASVGKIAAINLDGQEGYYYTFGVLDEPAIRIYTFPGGYIFITKGYLQTIENEAQLAASLAREIGSINRNLLLETLINNQEAFSLLSSLKEVMSKKKEISTGMLTEDQEEKAKQPFSDPFETLDYFASPSLENLYVNKEFLTKKLLNKMLKLIPPYEIIVKKDLIAVETLKKTGYDVESTKDMILNLNKKQQQTQVINRTINIENWLGAETLKKKRANKLEGRYTMMIQRLKY
ncbi:MAG: M48 family metalloprotease [Cyanobacteriota bacterium]